MTKEERYTRALKKLEGGYEEQKKFFKGGIAIQNNERKVYTVPYAEREFEFTCSVLISSGFCNSCRTCESCQLMHAHEQAKKDILAGKRNPNLRDKHGWEIRMYYDKHGRLTQIVKF